MNPSTFPKISIVTPSFNQGEFLEATIKSVLNQEYPNLEYIIIDGGSTDGSVEIIKKYEESLHFWCSEPDGGHYDAVNKGFSHSTGDIMAWLNSDDMYYPWAFCTVASIMSQFPDVRWLTTLYHGTWDSNGFCRINPVAGYSRKSFLRGLHIPGEGRIWGLRAIQQESTLWRRELWEEAGGQIRTCFDLAGDFDLWSRFYACDSLFGVSSPLGGIRSLPNQRSRKYFQRYLAQAHQSLSEMRNNLRWKPDLLPLIQSRLKFAKSCSALSRLLLGDCEFNGKMIYKPPLENQWIVEDYRLISFS